MCNAERTQYLSLPNIPLLLYLLRLRGFSCSPQSKGISRNLQLQSFCSLYVFSSRQFLQLAGEIGRIQEVDLSAGRFCQSVRMTKSVVDEVLCETISISTMTFDGRMNCIPSAARAIGLICTFSASILATSRCAICGSCVPASSV
jgi:hypothetical protein